MKEKEYIQVVVLNVYENNFSKIGSYANKENLPKGEVVDLDRKSLV